MTFWWFQKRFPVFSYVKSWHWNLKCISAVNITIFPTHFITRATKENIPQYAQNWRHKGLSSKAKSDSYIGARFFRKPCAVWSPQHRLRAKWRQRPWHLPTAASRNQFLSPKHNCWVEDVLPVFSQSQCLEMFPLSKLCANWMLYYFTSIHHLQLLFIQRNRTAQMILFVFSYCIRL